MSEKPLYSIYEALEQAQGDEALYAKVQPRLARAQESLKHQLRPYQERALQRFFHYETEYKNKENNNHLLFELATGAGKTVLMAALLPYFYGRGYSTFIFFVNSTAIVEKTKQNFCERFSSKYVFAEPLVIEDERTKVSERVKVQQIQNLEEAHPKCINIIFTTIQGLHSQMQNPKENTTTLEDFKQHKVVLLADEAHHNSTNTRSDKELFHSWEDTVQEIYQQNKENYLLEFTATAQLDNKEVEQKYHNKVIMSYDLKEFCQDGYAKNIRVALTQTENFRQRFLLAAITSQFRQEVAAEYDLSIKPVLLFISKTIQQSREVEDEFHKLIEHVGESDIAETFTLLQKYSNIALFGAIYHFFNAGDFSYSHLAARLHKGFSPDKCINVNNDSELGKLQVPLNTLEDSHNPYRVIFAVNKLNEGWDVLNLYDIVKLYETKTGKGKPSTTQEIQLIGRGARLYPFVTEPEREKYKRKYDDDSGHDLSILEQLHFHTADDSAFIQQLNEDLENTGLKGKKQQECEVRLKQSFMDSELYKEGHFYTNKQLNSKPKTLGQYNLFGEIDTCSLEGLTGSYRINVRLDIMDIDEQPTAEVLEDTKALTLSLKEIPDRIFLKAVAQNKYYHLERCSNKLALNTILAIKEKLKQYKLTITYPKNSRKAEIMAMPRLLWKVCENFLANLQTKIENEWSDFIGTKELVAKPINQVFKHKKVLVNSLSEMKDCQQLTYFAQEQVKANKYERQCIKDVHQLLRDAQLPIQWLLRNERHFKLYNFADGQGFEPDFLLMLENNHKTIYQIFIEPKGEHLQDYDRWKETLMQEFAQLKTPERLYQIIALPFYNPDNKDKFMDELRKSINHLQS